jgi:hypothetical protein
VCSKNRAAQDTPGEHVVKVSTSTLPVECRRLLPRAQAMNTTTTWTAGCSAYASANPSHLLIAGHLTEKGESLAPTRPPRATQLFLVRTLYGCYSTFCSKEVSHAQLCQAPG